MLVPLGHPKMTIPQRRQHSTKKMILDIHKILTSLEFSIGTNIFKFRKFFLLFSHVIRCFCDNFATFWLSKLCNFRGERKQQHRKRSEELNASESFSRPSTSDYHRAVGAGGPEGPQSLLILADQLTLTELEGQIMPTTLLLLAPHGPDIRLLWLVNYTIMSVPQLLVTTFISAAFLCRPRSQMSVRGTSKQGPQL